jgi:zinc protease
MAKPKKRRSSPNIKRRTTKTVKQPAVPTLDTSSLPGPDDTTRVELPNGIVVLARENFTSPAVVINGSLQAGGLDETREKSGLARFTAACLMRGTERYSFAEIYEQVESIGARLSFGGGTHTTGFGGKALAEDLDFLLGMAADALRRPAFPLEHVEKVRGEMMTGYAIRAHDTGSMASMAFDELLYPGHPYGVADDGYPETVATITRDEIVNFHQTHYGPKGMIVVVVGAVKADEAVALVQKHFGDWQSPQPSRLPLPSVPLLAEAKRKHVAIPGKSQSDIVMGCVGPTRNDPDFLDARMANNIFGVFGMYGRLGDVVREKHGLAYYVYSQVTGGLGPGPWQIVAGVNPKNVELAVSLIVKEIERLATKKVSAVELADNKSLFVGRLPLQLETNEGVAAMLESIELYSLGLDYLRRYPSLINAITRESAQAAAARYLDPERFALATAGPSDER